ncbi:MAG: hypothetical protein ACQEWW_16880 [Bacillota bacterium]
MEKEIKKLIKTSCANFIEGKCALFGAECPLIDGGEYRGKKIPVTDNSCSFFEKFVLPSDKALEAEYHGKEIKRKNCKKCGESYSGSKSNHCEFCRETIKRDKARLRKQKERG